VLGRFLELSVATDDIRGSIEFYRKLGFIEATVGDAWNHPYAVVSDGRIALGLHQQPDFIPSLTFVKPDLLKHLQRLESLGITFAIRRLGDDVFNELAWFDETGHLLRLVEARTFSPAKRTAGEHSACGYFVEIALPAAVPQDAKAGWEGLGFVAMDEEDTLLPHVSCLSDTIGIGLYAPDQIHAPTLMYEIDDVVATRSTFKQAGLIPAQRIPPALPPTAALKIVAPEGTPILMTVSSEP